MTTIVIANQKGGVGKTTTAITLGAGFAGLGYKTLIVDTDPQGNVASFLGIEPNPGFFNLVVGQGLNAAISPIPIANLSIVASDSSTVNAETLLRTDTTGQFSPTTILGNRLSEFTPNGSGKSPIIIIDTAPSLSSIQVAALCAADWLLIPATPEYASETGIAALSNSITELQRMGAWVKLLGIIPTMVDVRRNEHKQTILDLRETFPGLVLHAVRNLTAIAEAPRQGLPIWDYRPEAAQDYARVLAGVIKRVG